MSIQVRHFFRNIDWTLVGSALLLLGAGLVTMYSFVPDEGGASYFSRQLVWSVIALGLFFFLSFFDYRFLKRTRVVVSIYLATVLVLLALFVVGSVVKGAQSWFDVGLFSIQPAEIAKLALIILLAKYFSRRHVEIARVRHVLVSGLYAFILFVLVLLQPDFGSAIILFLIWLGMVFVSGISKKHLLIIFLIGLIAFGGLWSFVFTDIQKDRLRTFIDPLADLQGTGYNAYQSTVAVGSGQIMGKGIGFGTQSRLQFLPEYETDFIFAAFAEEWGFVGVMILFLLFGVVLWRIVSISLRGSTNFEILFGLGVAILFLAHFFIHVGMNIGLLPITGTTIPFMSYGGSHLIIEFGALGMLMGMRGYGRAAHREDLDRELLGAR